MAIVHGKNAKVLLNGVDISGDLNTITPKMSNNLVDYATFGVIGYKHLPGLGEDEVSFEALYNSTSADVVNTLKTLTSTGYAMMVALSSTVGGVAFAVDQVKVKDNSIKSVVTDINRLTANFVTHDYPFEPCVLLTTGLQTVSGNNAGGSIDNGASTNAGATAYLQMAYLSTGTFTISLDTAPDNVTWLPVWVSAVISSGRTYTERISLASTVDRYVRIAWLVTSTATFMLAFDRY